MGREIVHYDFPISESKKNIEITANYYYAEEHSDADNLYSHIRFIDNQVFLNRDKASEYIDKIDDGNYNQIAVKYYEYPEFVPTKKLTDLETRRQEMHRKYYTLNNRVHYSKGNVKSKFISCSNCESKINVSFIRSNQCPICHKELRPQTVIDTIQRYKAVIDDLNKQITDETNKLQEKQKSKAEVMWLVKVEYQF